MRFLFVLVVFAVLVLVGTIGVIFLGLPDVAATTPHWGVTEWVLSTTMDHSVQRRARDIRVPRDLDDPARIRAGASDYDEMCAGCHAAPGVEAGHIAKGLLPEPPELSEVAAEWSPAELFWISKHGVRMTGMGAFGPTHSDSDLWNIVAFVGRLPQMSATEYRALVEAGEHSEHEHSHHGPNQEEPSD
jgi:mono/diheme cytochrome c family protein